MTEKRVFLSRPKQQSEDFADAIRLAAGREVNLLIDPVIEIEFLPVPRVTVDAVFFSSTNAVRAFKQSEGICKEAFCIGSTTEKAASDLGLEATHLGSTIEEALDQLPDELTYFRGNTVSFDLAGHCRKAGKALQEIIAYRQVERNLSEWTLQQLSQHAVIAPVFSPNSARALIGQLLRKHIENIHFITMSEAVAEPLKSAGARHIDICDDPTRAAMLDVVIAAIWG